VSQRVRYREEAIEDFVRRGGFLADKPATDSVTASQAL
jgi:hypothetical protein